MFRDPLMQSLLTQHQETAVQSVGRYWRQLAAGRGIARRSDIDPSVIQDALEYAFVGERLSEGHARVRVAGGSILSVADMDVVGMPLAVLIVPKDRAKFTRCVSRVFEGPAIVTLLLNGDVRFGQSSISAQLRLYPLLDDAGHVTRMIGTFVTLGDTGNAPHRFSIAEVNTDEIPLTSQNIGRPTLTRGHLRLVVSNQ